MHPKYTKKGLAKLVTMSYNTNRRVAMGNEISLSQVEEQGLDEVHIIIYGWILSRGNSLTNTHIKGGFFREKIQEGHCIIFGFSNGIIISSLYFRLR